MKRLIALVCVLFAIGIAALAQSENTSDDNGFVLNMIQNQLSAPGRKIELTGVSGLLSSRARVQGITVSDDKGPWLRVDNVELDWTRSSLLLGRLNINRLSAEKITWLRLAEATPRSTPEAKPFSLPELPVSVRLQALDIQRFVVDEAVAGTGAEISVDGHLNLVGGALDTELAVRRLDPPGGTLDLAASFSNTSRQLALDLRLVEPKGGLLSKLLRIENEPALELSLNGRGPLDNVDVTFALDADEARIAGGTVALRAKEDGLGFNVDLSGALSPLIPPAYRDFFAGDSALRVEGVRKTGGGTRVDTMSLRGAVLSLDGHLDTAADGFPRSLGLSGTLGDPAAAPVTLPVPGGRTTLNSAQIYVNFGGGTRWNGILVLDRLTAGDIEMEDVTLNMGGVARNLDDPATRAVTMNVEGLATGVWAADPDVARALGTRIDLFADAALPPGGPGHIRQLQISGNGLSIFTAGTIEDWVYTGRNAIRIDDITPFGGLAGRDLGGAVDFRANGSVSPLSGGFDLALDGTATDLRLGDPRIDNLLVGETMLAGQIARDEAGIRTEGLRLGNAQVTFASDGQISTNRTDIGFTASVTDLGLIDPRLGGAASARGTARGGAGSVAVTLDAEIPEGHLLDRALVGAGLGFDGTVAGGAVNGAITGHAQLDDLPVSLAADILSEGDTRALNGLRLAVGPNTLAGDMARTGTQPITGAVALRAPDIAPLAALGLVEATGAIEADLTLGPAAVGQGVTLVGKGQDIVVGANRITRLAVDATVADALGLPMVNGGLQGSDMALGGVEIRALDAQARQLDQDRMTFTATSQLKIGTLADLSGSVQRLNPGFAVTLDQLSLRQDQQSAELTAASTITLREGAVTLTPLVLAFGGGGGLTAQGAVADQVDLTLDIRDLPLALGNTVAPRLGLGGVVNGAARVTGPRATPNIDFRLAAANVEAATLRGAGIPPLTLNATGATKGDRLRLDAAVSSTNGLAANVTGTVPLAEGALDLALDLDAFPLALVDRVAGRQGLAGTITGTGAITGTRAAPIARFDLRGTGVTARPLASNGLPPLTLAAAGGFQNRVLTIDQATASAAGGLDLTGSGRVPLSGPGLDMRASGDVPLSLANTLLAQRDAQASGVIRVTATVAGSLAAPRISGTAAMNGGTLVDPRTNIRLNDVTLDLSVADNVLRLRTVRADVAAGGRVSASGTLGLTGGMPADIEARIDDVRYTDGTFVSTRLDGGLTVRGPLLGGGGVVAGTIDLGETEISVAEGLGAGAQATLEQVTHYRPPPGVLLTLERAQVGAPNPPRPAGRTDLTLDVRIRAPRQIFVRGRGLDVELGGEMVVRGTLSDIQPVGQFTLRRGRLNILGQRLDFEEGSLQLVGNLDPQINFVARTVSDDVTATITVEGSASSPRIILSSEPDLPQDEILARIIFNRSAANLSAFQLAQLAAAAAELAGGGGNGLLDQLRSATGLDDLDIVTEADGSTAVRAGKYIDDNIYVDVQTGSDGVSRAQINLDINRNLSARGSVASDGNTTLGIFFERDY